MCHKTISFCTLGNCDKKLTKSQILQSIEFNGSAITFCMDSAVCHRGGEGVGGPNLGFSLSGLPEWLDSAKAMLQSSYVYSMI